MKFRQSAFTTWDLLKKTYKEFDKDNAIKLSASLSYYTVFSIAPLSVIILSVCSFFFGTEAVTGRFYGQINDLVGNEAAVQIQETITNTQLTGDNLFALIAGIAMLVIGASGVFGEIQSSINYIWGLRAKPKKGFKKFIRNRLMSFSMIGVMGFLLMVSLIANTMLDLLNERLKLYFQDAMVYLFYVLNFSLVFVIITLLFATIFRTLPDGSLSWKYTVKGASVTAVLFMIGKFAISLYLGSSSIASAYGAAGSVIVILVWVYYSAIILYFGAEFTKVYAMSHGRKIKPNNYAVEIDKSVNEIKEPGTL